MIAEIQARHDADEKALENGVRLDHLDIQALHNNRAWLLSDRKQLEQKIIGEQTAYNIAATDLENARESILHKDLAIKSLEIINREQGTEIRLLREAIKTGNEYHSTEYVASLGSINGDDDACDVWNRARAALAEFDKGKA